jgi:hypothetical protein
MRHQSNRHGLDFRNYLAGTIFFVLLIWGPINHSWTAWLVLRIGYLLIIPLIAWFLLGWVWNRWQLNAKLDSLLNRTLSGIIFIALIVLAILEATSTTHIGNTQRIRTRDGYEDVGDSILLQGPDYGNVFLIVLLAGFLLWFGVLKRGMKKID